MTTQSMPDEDQVREALHRVVDPEVGLDVVELGLVYAVRVGADDVEVDLTMTSPACPVADIVLGEAEDAVQEIVPDGARVQVNLVWDPPWDPSMMSEKARRAME